MNQSPPSPPPLQDRSKLRGLIKERLKWVTLGMGPVRAVVPGGEAVRLEANRLIEELEMLAPCDKPLNTQVCMCVCGGGDPL